MGLFHYGRYAKVKQIPIANEKNVVNNNNIVHSFGSWSNIS